ncbi:site-2 protease family protein [Sphingomonas parva]|uniref:Site-2 protease family protein n=1 Tax=Sphingomonas parva TaxID=2555898 RepID=A0A4Y8ZYA9_9SPHN|nr:site-2 protease family protein [Sphingomonas parva]
MQSDNIVFRIATWLVPLVIAIVLHEISHGWVANAFGDPTAKERGRLSPNPIRHVDPLGTVILPLALAVVGAPVFGWAKPVPVVAKRLRNPRVHMMIVALAGPAMNLALALLAALGLAAVVPAAEQGSTAMAFVAANLANFLMINLFLAIFNLLPIPPFDGSHVVEGLLPRSAARRYRRLGRFGFPLLLFLLVILPTIAPDANVVARLVVPPVRAIAGFLFGLVGLA